MGTVLGIALGLTFISIYVAYKRRDKTPPTKEEAEICRDIISTNSEFGS